MQQLHAVRVELQQGPNGSAASSSCRDSEFTLDVDLVLLAMGFTGVPQEGLLGDLGVTIGPRGAVSTDAQYRTNVPRRLRRRRHAARRVAHRVGDPRRARRGGGDRPASAAGRGGGGGNGGAEHGGQRVAVSWMVG